MQSAHITIRRMPLTAVFGLCAILIVHFFCCIPAMTCRTNADVDIVWILIAPYVAYTLLPFIIFLNDRDRFVYCVALPFVIAMLLISAAVSANLNSSRPHPGAQGLAVFVQGSWISILGHFLFNALFALCVIGVGLFGSVENWRKRRAFVETPGSFQFSMRAMLYLVLWVSLYCAVFAWLLGSRR